MQSIRLAFKITDFGWKRGLTVKSHTSAWIWEAEAEVQGAQWEVDIH